MRALTDEEKMMITEIQNFIIKEVATRSEVIDKDDHIPEELVNMSKEMGMFGLNIPEEYGGMGMKTLMKSLVEVELGKGNFGYSHLIGNHTGISSSGIIEYGNDKQKRKYLPKMATGEIIGAFALTEPQAGSDAGSLKTTAEKKGNHWILNGEKIFITNAPIAGVFTVMAVNDKSKGIEGISTFLVDRGSPGLSVGPNEHKMGMKGALTSSVIFDNCEVPEENMLGSEGKGYVQALKILTRGRVTISARCLGMMEFLLEASVDYAKKRKQFGKSIGEFQGIQWMLAEMATRIEAARLMVFHAAELLDNGEKAIKEAATTKLFATEALDYVADAAVQIHGGMGYMKDYPIERYYRDARITRIYEGTSEIQKMIIARQLLKD